MTTNQKWKSVLKLFWLMSSLTSLLLHVFEILRILQQPSISMPNQLWKWILKKVSWVCKCHHVCAVSNQCEFQVPSSKCWQINWFRSGFIHKYRCIKYHKIKRRFILRALSPMQFEKNLAMTLLFFQREFARPNTLCQTCTYAGGKKRVKREEELGPMEQNPSPVFQSLLSYICAWNRIRLHIRAADFNETG